MRQCAFCTHLAGTGKGAFPGQTRILAPAGAPLRTLQLSALRSAPQSPPPRPPTGLHAPITSIQISFSLRWRSLSAARAPSATALMFTYSSSRKHRAFIQFQLVKHGGKPSMAVTVMIQPSAQPDGQLLPACLSGWSRFPCCRGRTRTSARPPAPAAGTPRWRQTR